MVNNLSSVVSSLGLIQSETVKEESFTDKMLKRELEIRNNIVDLRMDIESNALHIEGASANLKCDSLLEALDALREELRNADPDAQEDWVQDIHHEEYQENIEKIERKFSEIKNQWDGIKTNGDNEKRPQSGELLEGYKNSYIKDEPFFKELMGIHDISDARSFQDILAESGARRLARVDSLTEVNKSGNEFEIIDQQDYMNHESKDFSESAGSCFKRFLYSLPPQLNLLA